MPLVQRELAIRSIEIARQALDITVHSPAYAEGMKYGTCHVVSLQALAYAFQPYITHMRQLRLRHHFYSGWRVSCKCCFRGAYFLAN